MTICQQICINLIYYYHLFCIKLCDCNDSDSDSDEIYNN